MPRIQSRLHADELQTTKQALAEAARDIHALHERVAKQEHDLDSAVTHHASLSQALNASQADLRTARDMLAEVQAHYEGRERRLQNQVRRLEQNVHTLEEMVQAARRRETASTQSSDPATGTAAAPPTGTSSEPCASCAQLRAELRRASSTSREGSVHLSSCGPSRPPRPPPDAPSAAMVAAVVPPVRSARSCYWQDQLLSTTQQAAACFDAVRRHTRDLRTCNEADGEAQASDGSLAAAWAHRLALLQRAFDEVVQADAKVISFTVLVAEQQSSEIRRLHSQWAEAQETLSDVEGVLDEAQARVHAQSREAELLREECATLTAAQSRCSAHLTTQARELQACSAALQEAKEEEQRRTSAHTREVGALRAELTQSRQLQQRATAYATQLEAALQDKQRLLESAATMQNERQQQAVLTSTRARVAQFVAQLSESAQQLQTSLSPSPTTAVPMSSSSYCATAEPSQLPYGVTRPKAAPSISSPEPSPPGVSASHSLQRRGTRSPSSLPYDDSLFLADLTQPFAA